MDLERKVQQEKELKNWFREASKSLSQIPSDGIEITKVKALLHEILEKEEQFHKSHPTEYQNTANPPFMHFFRKGLKGGLAAF